MIYPCVKRSNEFPVSFGLCGLVFASAVSFSTSAALASPILLGDWSGRLTEERHNGQARFQVDPLGQIVDADYNPTGDFSFFGTGTVLRSFKPIAQTSVVIKLDGVDITDALGSGTQTYKDNTTVVTTFETEGFELRVSQSSSGRGYWPEGVSREPGNFFYESAVLSQQYQFRIEADPVTREVPKFEFYRTLDATGPEKFAAIAEIGNSVGVDDGVTLLTYSLDNSDEHDPYAIAMSTSARTTSGFRLRGEEINATQNAATAQQEFENLSSGLVNDSDGDNASDQAGDYTLSNGIVVDGYTQGIAGTIQTEVLLGYPEYDLVPPLGSTEEDPFLPTDTSTENEFVFEFDPEDITDGETFFIDPIVAVGYTYTVTGASFASVTAPTLAAVNDGDGMYELDINGVLVQLLAGQTHIFGTPVQSFILRGIDPDLFLDPNDNTAFVTGVALTDVSDTSSVSISQAAITLDYDPNAGSGAGGGPAAPVPVPASVPLLLGGLGCLAMAKRVGRLT